MKNSIKISLIVLLGLLPFTSIAQQDFSQPVKEKINQLGFMVGEWKGTGWSYTPQGKQSSDVHEVIKYKLDSTVLFVEGKGTETLDDGSKRIVHEAMGIISYSPFTKKYNMDSFISKGMSTKASFEPQGSGKVIWSFDAGPSTIRYTLTVREGKWNEIGERSSDGENWQQFFEMNLSRL